MTTQPDPLRLADALQAGADDPMWADHCEMSKRAASLAAAELRRLHALNAELVEALRCADAMLSGANMDAKAVERKVSAALAKMEASK